MPTTSKSSKRNPDRALFALIDQHAEFLRQDERLLHPSTYASSRKQSERLKAEIAVLESKIGFAEASTAAGYSARVKAINAILFDAVDLVEIAAHVGGNAARLGIDPPALRSWQASAREHQRPR
jgi:hypothetical protein